MEFVLRGSRRGRGRRFQEIEVVRGLVIRRILIRYLAVPEVEIVDPGAQPVVLIRARALGVRIGNVGDRVGAAAGSGTHVRELRCGLEYALLVGRTAERAAAAAATGGDAEE